MAWNLLCRAGAGAWTLLDAREDMALPAANAFYASAEAAHGIDYFVCNTTARPYPPVLPHDDLAAAFDACKFNFATVGNMEANDFLMAFPKQGRASTSMCTTKHS